MNGIIIPVEVIVSAFVIAAVITYIVSLIPILRGVKTVRYEKLPSLFSPTELSFLAILEHAVGSEFRIMGKVRVGDLVTIELGADSFEKQKAFNRLRSKHLDFVLCDPMTLSAQIAIELDDQRQVRETFIDTVMNSAGIPIIHFSVCKVYSIAEIRAMLDNKQNIPKE